MTPQVLPRAGGRLALIALALAVPAALIASTGDSEPISGVEAPPAFVRGLETTQPPEPITKPTMATTIAPEITVAKIKLKPLPAVTAPRVVVQAASTTKCGQWQALIQQHFPTEWVFACKVMWCESKGNPRALNTEGSSASGLWQFLDKTWRATTGRSDRAYQASPEVQTAAAAKLRKQYGWESQWSCA